jgi:hypothetical protein
MPACACKQEEPLAGMNGSFAEKVASAAAVHSLEERISVPNSRVSAFETMPAGSFTFQLERQFVDVMQELSGSARERSDVAIRIVVTLVPDHPHNVGCIVDCHFVAHR